MYIDNFGDDTSIFLYCEFTDLEQFKVSFITNNDQHEGFDSINVSSGNTIDLTPYNDDLRKFDLIPTYDRFSQDGIPVKILNSLLIPLLVVI